MQKKERPFLGENRIDSSKETCVKMKAVINTRKDTLEFEPPRTMVDQIYKALKHAIARGDLAPGQVLKEAELQNAFNVSRAPIREAIRLLEAADLVVVDAYKKKYVRPITHQYLQDLMPVSACLEGFAANLAVKNITEDEINTLKKINGQMRDAFEMKNYGKCSELNFDFHRIFVKAARNEVLVTTIKSVKNSIIWYWLTSIYFRHKEVISISIDEHEKVIHEFVRRDRNRVEEVVRKHVIGMLARSLKASYFDAEGLYIFPEK